MVTDVADMKYVGRGNEDTARNRVRAKSDEDNFLHKDMVCNIFHTQ